jgi:serine/threonine protein phosphatase 1
MKKYFVMGDVHGFYNEMRSALSGKGFDENNAEHILIVCGDLFDRGSQAVELYNWLKDFPKDRFIYIRGNHEELLTECLREIGDGKIVGSYHFSNKTVNTISQFCGVPENEFLKFNRTKEFNNSVIEKMQPIVDWINSRAVDYAEIGNYIFVHGWIPCEVTVDHHIHYITNYKFDEHWKDAEELDPKQYSMRWHFARWTNGMDAWNKGVRIPNKTIVCGHYHCSWGWSNIRQKRKEFPAKNRKDWETSFEPFIDEGIIALDACTAYTGFCNCVVLEINI